MTAVALVTYTSSGQVYLGIMIPNCNAQYNQNPRVWRRKRKRG